MAVKVMAGPELTERLKACTSLTGLRRLQRDRWGNTLDTPSLDVLDDACMFGAAAVLGMIQQGVPVENLNHEVRELMLGAIRRSAATLH